jgi:hypothetical protein
VVQVVVVPVRSLQMAFHLELRVLADKVTQALVVIVALATLTPKPVAAGVVQVQQVMPVYLAAVTAVTDLQVQYRAHLHITPVVVVVVNVYQGRLVPAVLVAAVTGVHLPMVLQVQLIPAVAAVVRVVTARSALAAQVVPVWLFFPYQQPATAVLRLDHQLLRPVARTPFYNLTPQGATQHESFC